MATFEFFGRPRAEATESGDIWLHGNANEAGAHIRFAAASPAHAARVADCVNEESEAPEARIAILEGLVADLRARLSAKG